VQRGYPPERTVIVGAGRVADLVARKLRSHPEYGVDLVGCTDVVDLDRFEQVCSELRVERVVIAFSTLSDESLLEAIWVCNALNLKITVVPRLFEVIGGSVEIDQLEGMTLLGIRGLSRTRSSLMLKRAIDLAGAGLGLLVLAPLMAAIALAVKLDSRGGVLFSHYRIGRGNNPFRLYKFRTMVAGADSLKHSLVHLNEASAPMFKIRDDPRVTRVGRFLRRTSLDELPQLLNVLRGEMSLVGPRPLVADESDWVIGWHRSRLALTPGLTGPWQVMGRTAIPFEEMVKLDYLYVADWSLWNDLKLLVRTAPVVFSASGH
jgi:exopolysaccharide biosynthesis polyprenyl glycosylphosphotransferase